MKILMFLFVLGTMVFGEDVRWMSEKYKQDTIVKVCLDGRVYFYVNSRGGQLMPKLEYRNTTYGSDPTKIIHTTCTEGK